MIKLKLYKTEDVTHALKRLRKKVQKEGVMQQLFDRKYYVSKGEKAREALKHARYINSFKNNQPNM